MKIQKFTLFILKISMGLYFRIFSATIKNINFFYYYFYNVQAEIIYNSRAITESQNGPG